MPGHALSDRQHLLTVVIEDYFQVGSFSALIPPAHWDRFESRLRRSTGAVLQLLADTGNRATFFTRGWIADHHPEVLREVVAAGHEVACQGYFRHGAGEVSPAALAQDLRRARLAVEQAIGRPVHGHRTGGRWLREHELWLLDLVGEAGYHYDASLCALGRELSSHPAWHVLHRRRVRGGGELVEVPVSTFPLAGWQLPIAGGNWFRQAPDAPLRRAARRWEQAHAEPLVTYFHTWEFDAAQPRIAGASAVQRLRHYRHLPQMPARLRSWLEEFRFTSIASHLALEPSKAAAVVVPVPPPSAPAIVVAPLPAEPAAPLPVRTPLTLVIPCYNESATLPYLARTLRRFAERHGDLLALHYVFVDDGSRDDTSAQLQALCATLPQALLLRHPANRGIAAALLTGFAACTTALVAVLDADCSFDPDQLPAMLALMDDGVDVVSASPAHAAGAMAGVPRWRAAMSLGAAVLYRQVLRQPLTSYTSCFRLYRHRVLQGLVLTDPGFCGVAEILGRLDLAGCRIVEYPAVLEVRVFGQSKIRVLRTVGDHVGMLLRLAAARWLNRPLPARVQAWPAGGGGVGR